MAYRQGLIFTDFWDGYQQVMPEARHRPNGKETGQTAHIERWNATLRQRLGRFVLKTRAFSKGDRMHTLCLRWFVYEYNLQRLHAVTNTV